MDKNGDGVISLPEFRQACQELQIDSEEQDQLWTDMDMNHDDIVEYSEFIAACVEKRIMQKEEICWAAFGVFDVHGTGQVSFADMRQVLTSAAMENAFPPDLLKNIWETFTGKPFKENEKGVPSGTVDFDHFLAALGVLQPPSREASSSSLRSTGRKGSSLNSGVPNGGANSPAGLALPIAGRGGANSPAGLALPIAGRRGANSPAGLALPIAGRGQASPAQGLPIASRGGTASPAGMVLPTSSPGAALGLPIASRRGENSPDTSTQAGAKPGLGLPIPSRREMAQL